MLNYLKITANRTFTENGAVTYRSTMSHCLDFFAQVGGMRNANDKRIIDLFTCAYTENPDIAMKLLFYTRDIRGGIGERRIFRVILKWLAHMHKKSVEKNIGSIAEFGRYDDLLTLIDTPCEQAAASFIAVQLTKDIEAMKRGEPITLLAKWLPSVNASNKETVIKAKKLARMLNVSDADYRKTLSKLRGYNKIIENNLRERDYTFDYSKQPSKAMLKYRKAFIRNDNERYAAFLDDAAAGKVKIHTDALAPYEIISPIIHSSYYNYTDNSRKTNMSEQEIMALNTTWNAQEDLTNGENALVVVDGSGSMYGSYGGKVMPIEVALSLGIYFAERNTGEFHNHFITFSENPQLVEIKGDTIADKVMYCSAFNEVANTNIQRVFELILKTAVMHNLPQSEMPASVYIISDMEFDCCTKDANITNFDYAERIFAEKGYKLPQIIFWNVNSRRKNVPVDMNRQGAVLVSGCSPKIFSMIKNRRYNPFDFMLEVIESGRYDDIAA